MKFFKLVTVFLLASQAAVSGEINGKTFCRPIETEGMFGQPNSKKNHCVSFTEDTMTDDANTSFGNPPTLSKYVLVGGKVLLVEDGKLISPYKLNESENTLSNNEDIVLSLE